MELIVSHPAFQKQRLVVRTAGFFRGPGVLLNGTPVKRVSGKYAVRNDNGEEAAVKLKANLADPIPGIKINDEKFELARPLTWYEYLWIGLPILLLFVGGALGAGIGVFATYSSSRIIRSDRSVISKYSLTGLVSICAFVAFFVVAAALQIAITRSRR